ncbi:uncharacterized protein LOC131155890 [Malania oleifera]|uniref:uncharacterized protein LOC131155890 n=1 Tax=Malania oleifera TaxID=397392 RepID=UPI0025AE3278|nr:uncharacterized protein LOC131155890 [Malania oleifera]
MHQIYLSEFDIWVAMAKHGDSPLFKKLVEIKNLIVNVCGSSAAAINLLNGWDMGHNSSNMCYDFWRNKGTRVPWFKEVWNSGKTPKHSFILWFDLKGKLLTNENLIGDDVDHLCELCRNDIETIDHLFFKCSFSSKVWGCIRGWLGLHRSMSTLKAAVKWLHKEAKGTDISSVGKRIGLTTTVYFLWHFRNRRKLENDDISYGSCKGGSKTHL